jgi:hypothetical protein
MRRTAPSRDHAGSAGTKKLQAPKKSRAPFPLDNPPEARLRAEGLISEAPTRWHVL